MDEGCQIATVIRVIVVFVSVDGALAVMELCARFKPQRLSQGCQIKL